MKALISALVVISFVLHEVRCTSYVVETKYGKVRGIVLPSREHPVEEYLAFMNIPYAQQPVGPLRFKEPQPLEAWEGVLDGTEDAAACIHSLQSVVGKEDCLTLNIYLPQEELNSKLDVMVHIHGGALMIGSGNLDSFDPSDLVSKNVVVVSINYRLGLFGFLSTGDDVVSGNNGLKDQVAALKWVKENIAKFGGNPDSVTIFGCSAGGWSVHSHVLSPLSKGLFHRAIAQSGVSTTTCMLDRSASKKAKALGELLECPTDSTEKLVECLRTKDAEELIKQQQHFSEWLFFPLTPFGPVVETRGNNKFFPQHPSVMLDKGDYSAVPFMTGVAKDEGAIFAARVLENDVATSLLNSAWEHAFGVIFEYQHLEDTENKFAEKIRRFYFDNRDIDDDNWFGLVDAYGDRIFLAPMFRALQQHARHNKAPTYAYKFTYSGDDSTPKHEYPETKKDYGVSHADDFLFVTPKFLWYTFDRSDADREMVDTVTTLWTNFAKTGNPTPNKKLGFRWEPVTSNDVRYLELDSEPVMKSERELPLDRIQFWDELQQADLKTDVQYKRFKHDEF